MRSNHWPLENDADLPGTVWPWSATFGWEGLVGDETRLLGVSRNMARKYDMTRRAVRQQETHNRILEAIFEVIEEVGIERTTISAIANQASVERLTVYRHFPNDQLLMEAAGEWFQQQHPLPNPDAWKKISDPRERLRTALLEVAAYNRKTAKYMPHLLYQARMDPKVDAWLEANRDFQKKATRILSDGWGRSTKEIKASVAHGLDFNTWNQLAGQGPLNDAAFAEVISAMVAAQA